MHRYNDIISLENLCLAWREFLPGKKSKEDVAEFTLRLSENLLTLHEELENKSYRHGGYKAFNISDPKPRNIHKATVRDRVLHHAIYRILYPFFDRKFIHASFSCRNDKGMHRGLDYFEQCARRVSRNNTRTCWVLKCDIKKFFATIYQDTLLRVVAKHVPDKDIIRLLGEVIGSFETAPGKGLPLGNLTSQLLVNIYMNEFDQYVKRDLRIRHYVRYADDFILLSDSRKVLEDLIPVIREFLAKNLGLSLHPHKVSIMTWASGVDFLGWVSFPHHRVLRTTTKRRMFKNIARDTKEASINSYLGMLKHGNARKLEKVVRRFAG